MDSAVLIGFGGLVLSVLTYFAGVYRTQKRHEKDDSIQRVNRVIDEYQALFMPRKDSGIPALITAGVTLLRNDAEVREVCRQLEARNEGSPLVPHIEFLKDKNLYEVFQIIRREKLNPRHPELANAIARFLDG